MRFRVRQERSNSPQQDQYGKETISLNKIKSPQHQLATIQGKNDNLQKLASLMKNFRQL
jgi:hypothetical protein